MKKIEEIYKKKCNTPTDINEHLTVLKKYAEESEVIIEMGVRSIVSTWAFLFGKPKKLISIDMVEPKNFKNHDPDGCDLDLVYKLAKENDINFQFLLSNSLQIEIPECDFLFLDTLHDYNQVKSELKLHANKVKKYIGFHDTVTFKIKGETPGELGIGKAIDEFLQENKDWIIHEEFFNNNGLTIIKKIK
jgi:hypothetical protein